MQLTTTLLPHSLYTRLSPELKHGSRTAVGTPVRIQLLGSDPAMLARAFADDPAKLDKLLSEYPAAITLIGRAGGIYGDFFNFYLCDISLKLNGLQPGGPVRTVNITKQPSGRCTPK